MRLGVRGKLLLGASLVITSAVLAGGFYLEPTLRSWLENRIIQELARHARTGRIVVENQSQLANTASPLAHSLAQTMAARVTIIDGGGVVIGDSSLLATELGLLDNHGNRPEVITAAGQSLGVNRRYSTTLDTQMLYVAVPYQAGGQRGTFRVATPLVEVDRAITRLRATLLVAVLVGMLVALLLGGWASHLWSKPVRNLVAHTRAIARGEMAEKISISSQDELAWLAGSFNHMLEELQRLVSALGDERNRFQAVLEGMSEGVLALDAQARITHVNHRASELLGLVREPTGLALLEAVRTPALSELVEAATPRPTSIELNLQRGLRVLATASAQPGGGVILVLHDLTELRKLRTVRQDFVANVSHELRTPVSVILANSETLLDGALDDRKQARTFVEALQRNAKRLSTLISDLLELSRIDGGHYPLRPQSILLRRTVQQAVDLVSDAADLKQLKLQLEIPGDLRALADTEALQQVLVNLVDNAIKYTPDHGTVCIRAHGDPTQTVLEVVDNGPGIPAEHRDRLFERFYRVDKGRSRQQGGTGLGLSIVKNLVEAMAGEVGYRPAESGGAVFWVRLPVVASDKNTAIS